MTLQINKFLHKIDKKEKILLIIFAFVPICYLIGNLFINLIFVLTAIIFIYEVLSKYPHKKNISPIFWVFLFFFITLIINIFFSIDPLNSLPRVLKVLLILFFIYLLQKKIQKYPGEYEKIVFAIWSLIFLIVTFDVLFELFFGFNTLGFQSRDPGRVASFFGTELVVGSYFFGFCLITLSYVKVNYENKKLLNVFLIILFIIVSFMIGERSNFIKTFLAVGLFIVITGNLNFKNLGTISILIFISLLFLMKFNYATKDRYSYFFDMTSKCNFELKIQPSFVKKAIGTPDDIEKKFCTAKDSLIWMYKSSQYGAHYNVAYKIFQEYPMFGVGIKNFRYESNKNEYENVEYERTKHRQGTHPHQIHFEILAETGIFGYTAFLIFIISSLFFAIRSNVKNRNIYQLSGIIFVMVSLIPMLPSGSFFSTFSSGLFWINFAIMVAYIKE